MDLLTVTTREVGDWTVVALVGQLDVATAPDFRQTLLEVQYGGGQQVVLDLRELEFLDSFGLGVIVGGVRRARTHDGDLVLVCPAGRIRHVFEVTGVDRLVALTDDLESALSPRR